VERAVAAGEESLAAATAAGSQEQLMYTSNDIVCAYREAGLFERARQAAIRATELAQKIDNKPIGANSRSTRASVEFMDGNYDTATRLWSEANGIAESIGNFWGRSMAIGGSASARFERGDLGAAIQGWEESLRLADAVGFLMPNVLHRGDLGWCYRIAGAGEQADRHLEGNPHAGGIPLPVLTRADPRLSLARGHRVRHPGPRGDLLGPGRGRAAREDGVFRVPAGPGRPRRG